MRLYLSWMIQHECFDCSSQHSMVHWLSSSIFPLSLLVCHYFPPHLLCRKKNIFSSNHFPLLLFQFFFSSASKYTFLLQKCSSFSFSSAKTIIFFLQIFSSFSLSAAKNIFALFPNIQILDLPLST